MVDLPHDEPALMREVLDELGLESVFDVHTHFLPARMMAKVWAAFDSAGPLIGRRWPIAYRYDEERRVETLRVLGVGRWSSLTYPHKPGMAAWLNDWTAGFAATHADCLHSATFYPEPGAGAYVREAITNGAQIFKAHVQVGDYDPNDPILDDVWSALEETRTPLVIHSGDGPVPGQFTGAGGMRHLLGRYPDLVLIIAHLGMPDYTAFLDLAGKYEHVHLDTTMAFTHFTESTHPFPEHERRRLVELGDRILWGSDFPNIPYPYTEAVRAVLDLRLGADWNRGVLHDNAARLFARPRPGRAAGRL